MDQLRTAWAWFQRQHFWVLIVVAILIALGLWIRGTGALKTEYTANKQKIEQEFTSIDGQRKTPFHPNDKIIERQKTEIANHGVGVNDIWKQLYERQRAKVLTWPDVLSDRFRKDVEKLKFGQDIPLDMRNNYRDYVGRHFPALPKIVDAAEQAAGESSSGRGMSRGGEYSRAAYNSREGGQAGEPEDDHLVEWLDQQHVRDELDMPTTPTPMKIWVTQEDLWVYETLLGIIAQTNKAAGADRRSNAAVRVITSLEVGREAALESRTRGRITMAVPPAAAAGGDMAAAGAAGPPMGGREMGGRGAYEGGEGMGGRGGGGGPGVAEDAGASDATLLASRYLDTEEKPLAAPDPAAGVAAFGTEYKRLPVRMELVMDVRWLPRLIAECADAPLQVEVKEVRVNPSEAGSSSGYGGRGGGYSASNSQLGDEMTPDPEPNIKRVIIQGIIYIFNEPDATALKADTASTRIRMLLGAIAEQRRTINARISG